MFAEQYNKIKTVVQHLNINIQRKKNNVSFKHLAFIYNLKSKN
jgi:hypothetical protein